MMSLGESFRICSYWEKVANEIGIPRNEQLMMSAAFRI